MLVWTSRTKVKTPRMNKAGSTAATNGAKLPGSLGEEPEGDQAAGDGAQVDRGAAVGFGDGGGAGACLDEVLGHQGSDEGLLPCVFIHEGSCPAVVCSLIVAGSVSPIGGGRAADVAI